MAVEEVVAMCPGAGALDKGSITRLYVFCIFLRARVCDHQCPAIEYHHEPPAVGDVVKRSRGQTDLGWHQPNGGKLLPPQGFR